MRCKTCGSPDCRTLETRELLGGTLARRRKLCLTCGAKFNTFELYDSLWKTIVKYAKPSAAALAKRWALRERNARVCERLMAGEKCETVGLDFGLSPSMVATIARQQGLPPRGPGGAQRKRAACKSH